MLDRFVWCDSCGVSGSTVRYGLSSPTFCARLTDASTFFFRPRTEYGNVHVGIGSVATWQTWWAMRVCARAYGNAICRPAAPHSPRRHIIGISSAIMCVIYQHALPWGRFGQSSRGFVRCVLERFADKNDYQSINLCRPFRQPDGKLATRVLICVALLQNPAITFAPRPRNSKPRCTQMHNLSNPGPNPPENNYYC